MGTERAKEAVRGLAPMRVLVVEDTPDYQHLLILLLAEGSEQQIRGEGADTIEEALRLLDSERFDAILLDLELPDSWGLDTVLRIADAAPHLPVVVVTASQSDDFGSAAIRAGAEDLVVKGEFDAARLAWILVRSIERHRRTMAATETSELAAMSRQAWDEPGALPAEVADRALTERMPRRFEAFAGRYADLIDLALEEQIYRTTASVRRHLERLADELAEVLARPSDLATLHIAALRSATRIRIGGVHRAQESRLLLLQLMGMLADRYRRGALASAELGVLEEA